MKKNTPGQLLAAKVISVTDGSNFSGTVSVQVMLDGGTLSAGSGTVTNNGGGVYTYAPTQAETNGDYLVFEFSGTGALPVLREFDTRLHTFAVSGDAMALTGAYDAAKSALSASAFAAALPANFTTLVLTNGQTVGTSTFAAGGAVNVTQWNSVGVGGMPLSSLGTNAPAGWINAAAIAAAAFNGKGDWLVSGNYTAPDNTSITAIKVKTDNLPSNPAAVGSAMTLTPDYDAAKAALSATAFAAALPANFAALLINPSGHVSRVVLVDTMTTYTGNTPQSGDAYARLGDAGAGLTGLGDPRLGNLDAPVSSRSTLTAGAVYEELMAGHTTTGSYGQVVNWIMATLASAGVFKATALANAPTGGGASAEAVRIEMDQNSLQLAKLGNPASGSLAADIADLPTLNEILDADTTGREIPNSLAALLKAAGNSGDPWSALIEVAPGVFRSTASLLTQLYLPAVDGPVIPVPATPAQPDSQWVAVYVGDPDKAGVEVSFKLSKYPATTGWFFPADTLVATTNENGLALIELPKNTAIKPDGTRYLVTCPRIGMDNFPILLDGDGTFVLNAQI